MASNSPTSAPNAPPSTPSSALKAGHRDRAVEHFRSAVEALTEAYGADDARTRAAADRLKEAQDSPEPARQ
jgi:hypothetical protein